MQTWDFLWSAIKQADVFVSQPVPNFVPDDVPMENVVRMSFLGGLFAFLESGVDSNCRSDHSSLQL
jgi:hypothetical protein